AALALCLALLLTQPTDGEELPKPSRLRFAAEIARHLLRWEPAQNSPSDVRYDVEYLVYGMNLSWTDVPNCINISEHSCDLTYYTLDPGQRYYARVRAVSGNHSSSWERTSSFSPQEAGLRLSGHSLSVSGNAIHVELQLLLQAGNVTVKFDEIHEYMTRYRTYVRRTQDNQTFEVVETATVFTISNLHWGTEYCLSVEPGVTHRRVPTTRTDEQCVTIGHRDRTADLLPGIFISSFVTLLLLSILGALLVCTYIKKPVRTPSVLKSFMKQSSLWVEQEPPASGSLDADPIQQLFLCQKEPQPDNSPDGRPSTAQQPLEKDWRLPAWPVDRLCLLELTPMESGDSSGNSTDSGICLHIPSSSSSSSELSCSAGPEPQGYRQQLPTGDDSGVSLKSTCPSPTCSSGSGNAVQGELSPSPATGQEDVEFRGYLQQSKGTVEPRQDPAKGVPIPDCAGSVQGTGSTDIVLDVECSELAVAKGYLKQTSLEHPHGRTLDLAPCGAPWKHTALDFSSQTGPRAPTLLSWGAPGAPLTSKASPELLKTPFDLNIFNTDFLGLLPLSSSLSTDWLMLPGNPLSLLNGDSKDSRL
ncbi:Interleukin-10 receptor subunit alpha, partial [Acanthisitta chloris]